MTVDLQPETERTMRLRRPGAALIAAGLGAVLCIAAGFKVADLFVSPTRGRPDDPDADRFDGRAARRGGDALPRPARRLRPGRRPALRDAGGRVADRHDPRDRELRLPGRGHRAPWVLLVFDVGAAIALLWGPLTSGRSRIRPALAIGAAGIGSLPGRPGRGSDRLSVPAGRRGGDLAESRRRGERSWPSTRTSSRAVRSS